MKPFEREKIYSTIVFIFIMFCCFSGCRDESHYYLNAFITDPNKVYNGVPVLAGDAVIGKVQKIEIFNSRNLVKLIIEKRKRVPSDSKLWVEEINILGDRAIILELGKDS